MRASRSIPWAVSLLSVFWATFPDAAAGTTIFGRVSNVFAPGSTTGGGATTTSMSSGSATAENAIDDELEELGDAFEEDRHLSQILRLMDGDDFGVVQDAWRSKGMEQLFTDPQGLRTMLTAMPMLKAFKGVEEIAAKETLTPEDGKAVLGTVQAFATKLPEKLAKMSTSESLAQTFKHYAELEDPKLKELMAKSNAGSWKASMGLHKHIMDLEWDGLIDVEKFGGLDGKESSTMKMQRELFQQLEPELFKYFMHKDPMVKKYVTNPAAAYEEAKVFAQYNPELDVL